MQVHHGSVGKGIEELPDHLRIHAADPVRGKGQIRPEIGPARQIDGAEDQSFVHWKDNASEPLNGLLVTQGLPDSLAQYDAAVLYGMVAVHLQIPLAVEGQIKEPVPCKAAQHVVEKAYARIDVIDPSSVQGDGAGFQERSILSCDSPLQCCSGRTDEG